MKKLTYIALALFAAILLAGGATTASTRSTDRQYQEADSAYVEYAGILSLEDYDYGDSVAVVDYDYDYPDSVAAEEVEVDTYLCDMDVYNSMSDLELQALSLNDDYCAMYALGKRIFNDDNASEDDMSTAVNLMVSAAWGGCAQAKTFMGTVLLTSDESDDETKQMAAQWLLEAAMAGDEQAIDLLNALLNEQ